MLEMETGTYDWKRSLNDFIMYKWLRVRFEIYIINWQDLSKGFSSSY